jgi:hypothetical protein
VDFSAIAGRERGACDAANFVEQIGCTSSNAVSLGPGGCDTSTSSDYTSKWTTHNG